MAIPDFTSEGVLPMSIHNASLNEIKEKFCSIGDVNERSKLYNMFIRYLKCLKKHEVKFELYLDGSFVTNKDKPGDIDILIFYDYEYSNMEWLELITDEYSKRKFSGIQVLSAFLDTESMDDTLEFAYYVKDKPELRKGLVKVIL